MSQASQELLREGVLALQKAQQQTADLHRQFLEGQAASQQALLALLGVAAAPTSAVPRPPQVPVAPPLAVAPVAPAVAAPTPPTAPTRKAEAPPVIREPIAPKVTAPPVVQATSTRSASRDVGALLLAVVSEKTGYPAEMLTLEMGLDADLGIDSIKRVEILSALQEQLADVPRIAAEQLGALRTLQDIVNVLQSGVAAAVQTPSVIASSPAQSPPASNRAAAVLLNVVAEKTGYPIEMLGLEMGLDADLGIDSIKRVEILSAVQEQLPEARKIAADQLGALRTLADVAAALAPIDAPPAQQSPAPTTPAPDLAPIVAGDLGDLLLKVVADKTGYPIEMLNLEMGLDSDLGIDSIKRVEILSSLQEAAPALPRLGSEQLGGLRTLGDIVAAFGAPPAPALHTNGAVKPAVTPLRAPDPAVPEKPVSSKSTGALDLYAPRCSPLQRENQPRIPFGTAELWVVGAPGERRDQLVDAFRRRDLHAVGLAAREALARSSAAVGGLIFAPTDAHPLDRSNEALAVLQHVSQPLQEASLKGRGLLGVFVGFDGQFGLDQQEMSFGEPRQAAAIGLTKTARFEWPGLICKVIDADLSADADDVAEEFLTIGPLEVGSSGSGRCQISLQRIETNASDQAKPPFDPGALVVITGGGRGVTARVAEALASEFRPTLALLGRSSLDAEPNWLQSATTDAEIKRLLLANSADRPSPKELKRRCAAVLAQREVRATLAAIERAGGRSVYRTIDVRDGAQVAETISQLRNDFGPVRGFIHGAGVLADRLIVDKSASDYDNVYATKVDGAENVLAALDADELRLLVMFSSSTARFGRKGQSDYAAANEVLNKLAQRERRLRPQCRVVSFNWGPWDGGMVDQSLRVVFAQEGIEVIPAGAGAALVPALARNPIDAVEIVVLGLGSRTPSDAGPSPPAAEASPLGGPPMFERDIELSTHPVLRSHVIKGKAVVPTVLMVEWAAHAALLRNPGLVVLGAEDFSVLAGVKLGESDAAHLHFFAGKGQRDGAAFRVPVEIRGARGGKLTLHARGTILLTDRLPAPSEATSIAVSAGERVAVEFAYDELLFHGPALQALNEIEIADDGAAASVTASQEPASWFDRPPRSRWLAAPLAVDAAFQLAVVWCRIKQGAPCLPTKINRLKQTAAFAGPLDLRAKFMMTSEHVCHGDFEFVDAQGLVVARLSNCEFVVDPSLNEAFRRRECSAGS